MFGKGSIPRRTARSITFWIGSADALTYAENLARELNRRFPRLDVVFVQADGLPRDHGFDAFPPPPDAGTAAALTRLRTHTLIFGGMEPQAGRRLSEIAARRGAFQVLVAGGDVAAFGPHLDAVLDPQTALPEDGATRIGAGGGEGIEHRRVRFGGGGQDVRMHKSC